ncbi:MAG: hypothetical protein HYS20_10220 [Rhodocyclales bacterium]|nr:hypothetical protein [Rhodocyclales bacterium]
MSHDWRKPTDDPADELKEADILLEKADALLRRHKIRDNKSADAPAPDDDLPVLTDVVDDLMIEPLLRFDASAEPVARTPPTDSRVAPAAPPATGVSVELTELLVNLDTELAREVENWFADELPQLVTRELDRFAQRLREEATAHMRATLIPALSERIAVLLEQALTAPRDPPT